MHDGGVSLKHPGPLVVPRRDLAAPRAARDVPARSAMSPRRLLLAVGFASLVALAAGLATLSSDRTIDYPVLMAASLMAMAPVLIMFVVLQRRVMDGLASSGLK